MKAHQIVTDLNKFNDKNVYVKIEGWLYYPIKQIKKEGDNIIILCKDITKMEEVHGN